MTDPRAAAPSHRLEEHTGEVQLRVDAPTLPEVYAEAGRALAEMIAGETLAAADPPRTIQVQAPDREALLVELLNELVFRSEVDKRVYPDVWIDHVTDRELRATIRGAVPRVLKMPVKAATFHRLAVHERAGGWTARVILDV